MKPIIITGDHKFTAQAVAKELGMRVKANNIIDGQELDKMSDEKFRKKLADFEIYARVEPRQKLRIIQAWQDRGEVVAMTGDGINDSPALKQANIGIALGSGTDVAKEASDLILLTNSFSVIIAAVEEGRVIIDNIRKVVTFLFADAFSEIILVGASIIGSFPLPILPAQILWANLIEDSLPAVSLAFEPKEKDVMDRKPENPKSSLLTPEMKAIIFIIGLVTDFILLGLFLFLWKFKGLPIYEIRTIMFAALVIDSIFYIFSCKNLRKNVWHINIFSNKFLVISWLLAIVVLLAGIYIPVFQKLLHTVSLGLFDWFFVLIIGIVNLIFIEAAKLLFIPRKRY